MYANYPQRVVLENGTVAFLLKIAARRSNYERMRMDDGDLLWQYLHEQVLSTMRRPVFPTIAALVTMQPRDTHTKYGSTDL